MIYFLVGFLFICTIFLVVKFIRYYVLDYFKFIPSINKKKTRLCFVFTKGLLGEEEHADRLCVTAQALGYEAYIYMAPRKKKKHKYKMMLGLQTVLHRLFKPDLVIYLQHEMPRLSIDAPSYIMLATSIPFGEKSLSKEAKNLLDFDGVLFFGDSLNLLKKALMPYKNDMTFLKVYPNFGQEMLEKMSLSPKLPKELSIFYCGANWDKRRQEMKEVFLSLEKKNFLSVYGPKDKWTYLSSAYKGFLPFDNGKSLMQALNRSGIALCIHSQDHLGSGIPTARVIEAAAARTVIICDRHPYIEKYFKDSVLYLDENIPFETQIIAHYQKLEKDHVFAERFASKSHEVFLKHFTTEQLLRAIISAFSKQFDQ